ncbi:MAG: adenylyltransferase/cytidyltransferase family protein [Candidatus Woesearchaeota archaeon]
MTTVAVSGYFVYLHKGHVRLFKAARELGDKLVVIVNNDAQQEKKKGKVIVPEEDRAEVIRSIRYVDEAIVAIDDDGTVCKTLEQIKPDIFANGGDRTGENTPEGETCEKLGIEMRFNVGGEKADSSSRIFDELNKI